MVINTGSQKRAPTTEKERFQRNSSAAMDRGEDLTKIKEDMKLSLQRKGLDMTKTRVRARAGGTARCSAVWRGAAQRGAARWCEGGRGRAMVRCRGSFVHTRDEELNVPVPAA